MGRGIDPTRITILCIISSGQSTNTGQKIQEISGFGMRRKRVAILKQEQLMTPDICDRLSN